jgi:hypothetical protein
MIQAVFRLLSERCQFVVRKDYMENKITFSSVVQLLLDVAGEKYSLDRLKEWVCNEQFLGVYDRSNFFHCVKRNKSLGKAVIDYYEDALNLPNIADDIKDFYIVRLPLQNKLRTALEQLILSDVSLSDADRKELLSGSDEEAVAKVLRFAIIRQKQDKTGTSPLIEHLFDEIEVPHIARIFVGRESDLTEIEHRLAQQPLLYVSGIGGIGKSELTQEYAKRHRSDYQNILYFSYHDSLKETFLSGGLSNSYNLPETERYKKIVNLLKSLREDSLILIDDLSKFPEQDSEFSLLRKLKCHILITTRFCFDADRTYKLQTMSDPQELLRLFYVYCPNNKDGSTDEEDILYLTDLVHGHTQSILMLALTVKEGFRTVWELSQLIRECGLDFPNDVCIATQKDNHDLYEPFFQLLERLFSVQNLNEKEKNTLQNFSIMPAEGVTKRKFAKWCQRTREVQYLIRLGWIQEDLVTGKAYMHGIVRDFIFEILHPTILICRTLIDSLLDACRRIADETETYDYLDLQEVNHCAFGIISYLRENTVQCALYFILFSVYSHKMQHIGWKDSFAAQEFQQNDFDRITMEYLMRANLTLFMQHYSDYRRILDDIESNCNRLGGKYAELWELANEKLEEEKDLFKRLNGKIQLEKRIVAPMLKKRISPQGKHSKGKQRSGHRKKQFSPALHEVFSQPTVTFRRKSKEDI